MSDEVKKGEVVPWTSQEEWDAMIEHEKRRFGLDYGVHTVDNIIGLMLEETVELRQQLRITQMWLEKFQGAAAHEALFAIWLASCVRKVVDHQWPTDTHPSIVLASIKGLITQDGLQTERVNAGRAVLAAARAVVKDPNIAADPNASLRQHEVAALRLAFAAYDKTLEYEKM